MHNSIKIKNPYGRSYYVPSTDSFFIKELSTKIWQAKDISYLRSLCPHPRHVLDIGTNLGQSMIEYAQFAEAVTGFEPDPSNYKHAIANLTLNSVLYPDCSWSVYQNGLGEKESQFLIQSHDRNVGSNFLKSLDSKYTKNTHVVDVYTLDSFAFEGVDLIKIDVEGFELYVLRGGEKTITRDRPIIQTEMAASHCKRAGYTLQEMQDWFNDRDYVRTLKRNPRVPIAGKKYVHIPRSGDSVWIPVEKL